MSRTRSGWIKMGLVAVAALVCGACSGDTTSSNGTDEPVIESPLLLDEARGTRFINYEDAIGECMRAQGFDYAPLNPVDVGLVPEPIDPEIGADEFVNRYAWGISTLTHKPILTRQVKVDPHQEILLSLSPQARVAWEEALNGSDPSLPGGCRLDAFEQLSPNDAVEDEIEALSDAFERFSSDTRTLSFHREWSECMAGEGYRYQAPRDAELDFRQRADELVQQLLQTAFESSASGDELALELVELEGGEAVMALQRQERRLARASLACRVPPPYLGVPDELSEIWGESIRAAQG